MKASSNASLNAKAPSSEFDILPKKLVSRSMFQDLRSEKTLDEHQSRHTESFEESLEIRPSPNSRHQLGERELVFQSKFQINSPNPECNIKICTEPENLTENNEVDRNSKDKSMNFFIGDTASSPKLSNVELDYLLSGLRIDSRYLTITTPTNINSVNFSSGKIPENFKNDEILIVSDLPQQVRPRRLNNDSVASDQEQNLPESRERNGIHHLSQTSNQNHPRLTIDNTAPTGQVVQPQRPIDFQVNVLSENEIAVYLRKALVFFLTLGVSSLFLICVIQEKISIWGLLITLYCYWIYLTLENTLGAFYLQSESMKRRELIFGALEAICAILAQICINLKIFGLGRYTLGACIPFLLLAIVYWLCNRHPLGHKSLTGTLRKCSCSVQILLISLKVDQIIDWDWKIVFALIWVYLGICCFYFLIYGLCSILHALLSCFQQYRETSINSRVTSVGLLWYSMYYGLGIVGALLCYGFDQLFQINRNREFIINVAWLSVAVNFILILYTRFVIKTLTGYLQANEWSPISSNGTNLFRSQSKGSGIKFLTEKKENYFQMVSPSYFLPLNKSRRRDRLVSTQLESKKLSITHELSPISQQQLQGDKKVLDKKFRDIRFENREKEEFNRNISRRCLTEMLGEKKRSPENLDDLKMLSICSTEHLKKCSSSNELDESFKSKMVLSSGENIPEGECYICFQNVADAILMDCGHGGICYECAIASVQKKNACVTCRQKIEAIYKLDNKARIGNIAKSIEYTKVVGA